MALGLGVQAVSADTSVSVTPDRSFQLPRLSLLNCKMGVTPASFTPLPAGHPRSDGSDMSDLASPKWSS